MYMSDLLPIADNSYALVSKILIIKIKVDAMYMDMTKYS